MTEAIARLERTEALAVPMTVGELENQVQLLQQVMARVMKKDEHYGVIPGTKKPTLYKAGAEKLGMVFHLDPAYRVDQVNLDHGHREYEVRCVLTHLGTGRTWEGVGVCSTMEKKYRYCGKGADRIENPDIADTYNTVLKMAKKRSHTDAILTATAASDIFTQDLEPDDPKGNDKPKIKTPERKSSGESEDAGVWVGLIVSAQEKTNGVTKDGRKWTLYVIKGADGAEFVSFSDSEADMAAKAMASDTKIQIDWEKDNRGGKKITCIQEVASA